MADEEYIRVEVWEEHEDDDDGYVTMDFAKPGDSVGGMIRSALDGTGLEAKLVVVIGVNRKNG